ncbi:MAG: sigma-54-dependent transcriptional regulator [Candidatus Krumholzibacteriia bacterium]
MKQESERTTKTVLLVDDQATERRLLYHALKKNYRVVEAPDGGEALAALQRGGIDLVILDMHLPPNTDSAEEGVRLQRVMRARDPLLPVIVATGDQDRELALEMVRSGVADFLLKPIDPAVLEIVVARALERGELERENDRLRREIREHFSFGNLIGHSPAMRDVFAKLEKLARTDTSVLLLGESGTGKSAVARALHFAGRRSEKPFVVVDPAAMPESLMESELFGHVKGAFTGAETDKAGRIQAADGGTLFLDEIGNLNSSVQAKFLLFLDSRTVRPVGSDRENPVDVRVIAATNHDLDTMVRERSFRSDLLYRIQVATVVLPALRERKTDFPALTDYFLTSLCKEMSRPTARLSTPAMEMLAQYPWPGNVRQLKHVLESSLALADGETLDVADLALPAAPPDAGARHAGTPSADASGAPAAGEGTSGVATSADGAFRERVASFERRLLAEALEKNEGNKAAAGRMLGLDENQIRYLCRKHGLR